MAKVTLDPVQVQMWTISGYIHREMDEQNITQSDMAEELNMSQQTFSYRLKNELFTVRDLLRIFRKLKTSDADILRLMRCSL